MAETKDNILKKVKQMFQWAKLLLMDIAEFLKWFYHNSMLTESSFIWIILKKKNIPLKEILIIPLGLLEWFLSAMIFAFTMFFGFFAPMAMIMVPLFIVAIPIVWITALVQHLALDHVYVDPLSTIIVPVVLILLLWLFRVYLDLFKKARPALEKVRK